jgi:hypothetical protein
VRAMIASCGLALLAGCGADAGVPSVTVEVDGVEVTCRAETGSLDPAKCGEWGSFMIPAAPEATRIVITLHPGGERCEVDAFDANGDVIASNPNLPCRPLDPESSAGGDMR